MNTAKSIGCTNKIYIPHSVSYQGSCWWWKLQNSIFWSAFYLPYSLQIYSSSTKNTWPWKACRVTSHVQTGGLTSSSPRILLGLTLWGKLSRTDRPVAGGGGGCESLAQCSCRLPAQRLLISANWHSWWQAWVGAGKRKKVLLSARLQVCCPRAKVQPFEYQVLLWLSVYLWLNLNQKSSLLHK